MHFFFFRQTARSRQGLNILHSNLHGSQTPLTDFQAQNLLICLSFFLCVCSKATSTRSVDLAVSVSLCGPTVAQARVSPVCLPAGLPETRLSQATCALVQWAEPSISGAASN